MTEPTSYQIIIRGNATDRLLRPLLDDFAVDHPEPQQTRLTGVITDPSHLHGVLHHLTAVAAEVISVTPIELDSQRPSSQQLSPQQPNEGNQHD